MNSYLGPVAGGNAASAPTYDSAGTFTFAFVSLAHLARVSAGSTSTAGTGTDSST